MEAKAWSFCKLGERRRRASKRPRTRATLPSNAGAAIPNAMLAIAPAV